LNDERRRGQVCAFMTNVHSQLGGLDEALMSGSRALAIARSASSRLPSTAIPRIRRLRTRGLSSRKPTTRASWPSRSSRASPRKAFLISASPASRDTPRTS
jgi:hypothetical protein